MSDKERSGRAAVAPDEREPEFADALSSDLPETVEADFAPLPDVGKETHAAQEPVDPFQMESVQAQEAFDQAVEAASTGDEELAVQEYLRASKIAETSREWYLSAVACQRVGDFLLKPPPPCDPDRAFRMYGRAVAAYEQCGLFGEARELAYRQMCFKLRRSNALKLRIDHRVELFLHWAVTGFGYRPLRVMGTAIVIVLVYAFLYAQLNGIMSGGVPIHPDLWHCIYFSGITFATVGYGDFTPAPHVRMLALTEGFLGAFTIGLFVAVMANRIGKS